MVSPLERIVLGRDTLPPGPSRQVAAGIVAEVTAEGALFTLPDFDEGRYHFGPAPYLVGTTSPPAPGDRCLVLFAGPDMSDPWLVSWTAP